MSQDKEIGYPTPERSDSQVKSKKRRSDNTPDAAAARKNKKSKSRRGSISKAVGEPDTREPDAPHRRKPGRKLRGSPPFYHERVGFFVTLSPVAYGNSLKGAIAEHISPLLLTYFPPLDGVILAFENASLSTRPEDTARQVSQSHLLGQSIDEYGVTYIWLTADFLILRPVPGSVLEGVVNLQNQSLLGLLCYNYFNVSIESTLLPEDWSWVEDADGKETGVGHYIDEDGKELEGRIMFRVKDFEATIGDGGTGTITIFGTMR